MISPLLTIMVSPLLLQVQAGASCSQRDYFATHIEVTVDKKPINYIRDVSLGELRHRLKSSLVKRQKEMGTNSFLSDEGTDSADLAISGTTSADISFDTDITFLALPQTVKNSRFCLIFKDVTVNVVYQTNMTIARELEEGDCAYDSVLQHQMKHHSANEKVVDALVGQLKAELPAILSQYERNYVIKRDVNASYQEMIKSVNEALEPYQEDMDNLIKDYAAYIDTPEELKALANSCNQ